MQLMHKNASLLKNIDVVCDSQKRPGMIAGTESSETDRVLEGTRLATALSMAFIDMPADEIDAGIDSALQKLSEFAGASRAALFLFSGETGLTTNTHEWCLFPEDSRQHSLQSISLHDFPHMAAHLLAGRDVVLGSPADIPADSPEKRYTEERGFRPAFCVPLLFRGTLVGMLCMYGQASEARAWPAWLSAILRLAGDAFMNALRRSELERGLRAEQAQLRSLFESSPIATCVWRAEKKDDFTLSDYNAAALELTRGTAPRFLHRTASAIYPDRPDMIECMRQCLREKRTIVHEGPYRARSTGEESRMLFTFAYVSADLVMMHAQRVSQERQFAQAARVREGMIEAILENSPAVIYMKGSVRPITFARLKLKIASYW